jgi:hypothetical protein
MRTLPRAIVLIALACPSATQSTPPASAPDWSLPDLDGRVHRSVDLRGKTVVLEWLGHECPAVAHHYESGAMPAARARVRGDDLVWLSVDSGHTCADQVAAIRAWRAVHGHDVPYLLDPSGAVGRAFGRPARRTCSWSPPTARSRTPVH